MKVGKPIVSFALGVAVGAGLYLLPKQGPTLMALLFNVSKAASAKPGDKPLHSKLGQRDMRAHEATPPEAFAEVPVRTVKRRATRRLTRTFVEPTSVKTTETVVSKEVTTESNPPPAPSLATFSPMGYVEDAGGKLEAIISQENEVQVVHIGELISGRYRVTKITPDLVTAVNETLVQSPMAKPNGTELKELTASVAAEPSTPPVTVAQSRNDTKPLGYVEKAGGRIDAVVSDGDAVRLVPASPAETLAQVAPPLPPEGPSPSQDSPSPAPTVASRGGANIGPSLHSGESPALPSAPVVQEASYHVPLSVPGAADGSAPLLLGTDSVTKPAEAVGAASDLTASRFTEESSASTDQPAKPPFLMIPIGFVVKDDGEFAALLADKEGVYIVRQGDRFAGRYRALSVSADAVEAVEEPPPRQAHPPPITAPLAVPDLPYASVEGTPSLITNPDCLGCQPDVVGEMSVGVPDEPSREVETPPPRKRPAAPACAGSARGTRRTTAPVARERLSSSDPGIFVFQTLGYVETQDGEGRAIVAEGAEVYLVAEGDMIADTYQAISVDPDLVLAVGVPRGQNQGHWLSAQTESGGLSASKGRGGNLHFPLAELARAQALNQALALGVTGSPGLGMNLLDSSLTGFDLQSQYLMADHPNLRF